MNRILPTGIGAAILWAAPLLAQHHAGHHHGPSEEAPVQRPKVFLDKSDRIVWVPTRSAGQPGGCYSVERTRGRSQIRAGLYGHPDAGRHVAAGSRRGARRLGAIAEVRRGRGAAASHGEVAWRDASGKADLAAAGGDAAGAAWPGIGSPPRQARGRSQRSGGGSAPRGLRGARRGRKGR